MSRIPGWGAFGLLALTVVASIAALDKAERSDVATGRPYLFSLPDLSSPRATLQTLVDNGNAVEWAILANGAPWAVSPEIQRMTDTVNVTDLPASRRELHAAL